MAVPGAEGSMQRLDLAANTVAVDLDDPLASWKALSERDAKAGYAVAAGVRGQIYKFWIARLVYKLIRRPAGRIYRNIGTHGPEIDALADRIGMPRQDVAIFQRLYTIAHAPPTGCSSVIFQDSRGAMRHFRSLDWDVMEIGPATRLMSYRRGGKEVFQCSGILSSVGVLSATKPGVSVCINYLPGQSIKSGFDPLMRLRDIMAEAQGYRGVREAILATNFASPVAYSVCGTTPDEACVIEVGIGEGSEGFTIREYDRNVGVLVQTNHYSDSKWANRNAKDSLTVAEAASDPQKAYDVKLEVSSEARFANISNGVRALPEKTIDAVRRIWLTPPVWNHETVQWVSMLPAEGRIENIWWRAS
jgi:hypothetical protein